MIDEGCEKRRRRSGAAMPLLAVMLGVTASAWAAHGPEVTPNLAVNAPQQLFPQDNPGRNTSSITASADAQRLLVGFEDMQGLCGPPAGLACPPETPPGLTGFSFSTDGGASWTDGGSLAALGNANTAGHPWTDRLARSASGETGGRGRDRDVYFLTSRMQDETTANPAGLGIYRGHFSAGTFVFTDGQIINSANPNDEYSRQAIAAAKDGSGAAYVVLVNVDEICGVPLAGFGQIELWRTHDGGESWQGPVIVSPDGADITDPNNPNCGATGHLQIAPAVAIGPRGEVDLVWQYGPQFFADGSNAATDSLAFSRSIDGGKTFSPPVLIQSLNAMRDNPPVGYAKNRMNDQPRIAVAESGPHRGRIYVSLYQAVAPVTAAVAAQSLVSSQAFVMFSDDHGAAWSAPTPIAPPVPATGLKRFWPTVSLRPEGEVDVAYLQSQEVDTGTPCSVQFNPTTHRTGPASSLVDTYWVQSRDGGATFSPPLRVSSQTSDWCTAPYTFESFLLSNAGDYIGSTSTADRTLTVWPDDRNGPMDTFFSAIIGDSAGPHHREAPNQP